MSVINRRILLGNLAAVGASSVWPLAAQAARWSNGTLEGGSFHWRNGGGDPYRGSLAQAIRLAGINDAATAQALQRLIRAQPGGNSRAYRIRDGDRLGVMISGHGWVARNTVAWPSQWRRGASRTAAVWYLDNSRYGEVRVMKAHVCGNWLFEFFGSGRFCRCSPGQGDAC